MMKILTISRKQIIEIDVHKFWLKDSELLSFFFQKNQT